MHSQKQQSKPQTAQGNTPCELLRRVQRTLHTVRAFADSAMRPLQKLSPACSAVLRRLLRRASPVQSALCARKRTFPSQSALLRTRKHTRQAQPVLLCALLALPLATPKHAQADGLFGLVGVPSVDIEGYGWLGDLYLEHTLKVLSTSEEQPEPQINAVFVEDALWIISGQLQQQGYLYPAIGVRLSDEEGNTTYEGKWAGQELTPYLPPATEAAHVQFSIEPGLRFYFESINIEGLPADLTSNPASFFYPTDQLLSFKSTRFYNKSRGISGAQGIISRLRAMGYRDADVVDQKVDIDRSTGAVHFFAQINHGPVYYADELVIEPGSLALATKVLSGMPLFLHMNDATRLTPEWLQNNIQQVRNRYYSHGYPEVRIIVRYEDVSSPRSTEVSVSTAIDPVDATPNGLAEMTPATDSTQTVWNTAENTPENTAGNAATAPSEPSATAEASSQIASTEIAQSPASTPATAADAPTPADSATAATATQAPVAPASALEAAAAPVGINTSNTFDSTAAAAALLTANISELQPTHVDNTLQPVSATQPTAATVSDITAAEQQAAAAQPRHTKTQPAGTTPSRNDTTPSNSSSVTANNSNAPANGSATNESNGKGTTSPTNGSANATSRNGDSSTAATNGAGGATATNGGASNAAGNGTATAQAAALSDAIPRPSTLANGTSADDVSTETDASALFPNAIARYQRVIIQVQSGPQVKIGKIGFSGEYGTNMNVLESQLTIEQGEELDRNSVENTRNKLSSLGIFRSVEIEYVEVDENTWDVIYDMQMKQRTEISLIAGVGTFDIIRGGFLIEQNNLWGLAHNQRLRAVQSFKATDVTYRYGIPQLFGNDVDFYAKGSYLYRQEISFNRQEYGAATGLQHYYRPLRTTFDIQYSLEQLSARNRNFVVAPGPTQATVSAITLKASHNGVDNPIFPTKGWQARASAEFAIRDLGGQVDYQRLEMGVAYHTPLNESGLIFHTNLRHGVVLTPGTAQQDIPVNRRFFMGGENTVRGYRRDQASPLDANGNQIGAVSYILWQIELEQKLTEDLSFVTFLDAIGNAADISQYPFNETLASAGVGLNYRTFVGPLRLEYGYNVKKRPGDPDGTLQISIGFPF